MGGHGGLNILPQKKWNVYNWENRNIVQKDIRIAREQQEKEDFEEHRNQARNRIQQLKRKRTKASRTPSASKSISRSASKEQKVDPNKSNINAELKKIQDEKKNINFFEREEEEIKLKENIKARIELEKEFFKDKPFDLSTKFLGQYDHDKPWYLEQKIEDSSSKLVQNQVREQINNFKSQSDQFYQVLELDGHYIKQKQEQDLQEQKKKEKQEKKKFKKIQKLALQLKELIGSDSEEEQKMKKNREKENQRLRKERLQREKFERIREQKLMGQKYEFAFQGHNNY